MARTPAEIPPGYRWMCRIHLGVARVPEADAAPGETSATAPASVATAELETILGAGRVNFSGNGNGNGRKP